ncbi:conserved hypothetical protein [metagenome]
MSEKQSITDTVQNHTMGVMKKLESHIPLHIKSFSDFSREYMKLLEQGFKINCSIEKKAFGNIWIDEKSIKLVDGFLEAGSKFYSSQIDMTTEFFKNYLTMRLSLMESYNKFVKEVSDKIMSEESDKK